MNQQPSTSFWPTAPREGFSALCVKRFGEFVTADTADGIRLLQQRSLMLQSLHAIEQAKASRVVRHASVVSRS